MAKRQSAGEGDGKDKGKGEPAPAASPGRVSVIHLQGPEAERDWLTTLHRKSRLPKATIVRIALDEWAKSKGYPPSPVAVPEDE